MTKQNKGMKLTHFSTLRSPQEADRRVLEFVEQIGTNKPWLAKRCSYFQYWVYAPIHGLFAPSCFVQYNDLKLQEYHDYKENNTAATQYAFRIAGSGAKFTANDTLAGKLASWGQREIGGRAFTQVKSKWKFVETILPGIEAEPTSKFTPDLPDHRERTLRAIVARRGQAQFRNALIARYGARCQITGCTILEILEAAHIEPYRGEYSNHVDNGLLLRADIHTLFDLHLISFDPVSLAVHISQIAGEYQTLLGGKTLRIEGDGPSRSALREHWNKRRV